MDLLILDIIKTEEFGKWGWKELLIGVLQTLNAPQILMKGLKLLKNDQEFYHWESWNSYSQGLGFLLMIHEIWVGKLVIIGEGCILMNNLEREP